MTSQGLSHHGSHVIKAGAGGGCAGGLGGFKAEAVPGVFFGEPFLHFQLQLSSEHDERRRCIYYGDDARRPNYAGTMK